MVTSKFSRVTELQFDYPAVQPTRATTGQALATRSPVELEITGTYSADYGAGLEYCFSEPHYHIQH